MAEKKEEFLLPDNIENAMNPNTRDLVIVSNPKTGKGTILGDFTTKYNALVFDLEKGGYDYITAKKISIYPTQETSIIEAYENYIKYRNLLFKNKGKYDYLIIDGISDLDMLSEIGGTQLYMNSIIGKNFNRDKDNGSVIEYGSSKYRSVLDLADGAGYRYTREWFLTQYEIFRQISPYRIYAAHIVDKMIKENGKDEVSGSEIALTGKLKTIFASKVTSLAKLIADENKRYLNFEVMNDSIIAGSRNPVLKDKILISEKQKDGSIKTFWENIYK